MTGYTVHTGATEKFVQGWDQIFKKKQPATAAKTQSANSPAKKATKKAKKK